MNAKTTVSSDTYYIVRMLQLPLDNIQTYWQLLYMHGYLDYRLCDVDNPTWEDVKEMIQRMGNTMFAIVDRNGIQIDGSTEEIMALEPLAEKWKSFGWEVLEVNGSNISEIIQGINKAKKIIMKPTVIISYLIKGADISFMEHTRKFHGRPPNKEEFQTAIGEIGAIIKEIEDEM